MSEEGETSNRVGYARRAAVNARLNIRIFGTHQQNERHIVHTQTQTLADDSDTFFVAHAASNEHREDTTL